MLNVYFLKAVGFNHPLLFSGHRTSQRAPLLLLRNVEAHDHQYLHIFISFTNFYLHFLAQKWRWLGRRSAAPRRKPQGQHGDVPGQQHRRGVQQRRGCKRGQFRRQQDNLLYNCYIMVLCVDQCDMAPISAHPYLSLILINRLDFGSKKKGYSLFNFIHPALNFVYFAELELLKVIS